MKKMLFVLTLILGTITVCFGAGEAEQIIQSIPGTQKQHMITFELTSEVEGTVYLNGSKTDTTVAAGKTVTIKVPVNNNDIIYGNIRDAFFYFDVRDKSGVVFPMSDAGMSGRSVNYEGVFSHKVYIEDPGANIIAKLEDFELQQNRNGGITIVKYIGNRSNVIIPDTINGLNIDVIEEGAFECKYPKMYILESGFLIKDYDNDSAFLIHSVRIPNTITKIGKRAFQGQILLKNVVLPDSLKEIGEEAFYNCGLTTITIPDSVTTIERGAFGNNTLTEVNFSSYSNLSTINPSVFANNQLTKINFPASIKIIRDGAFTGNKITTVEIPNSVTQFEGFNENPIDTVIYPWGFKGEIKGFDWNGIKSITLPEKASIKGGNVPSSFYNFWISQNYQAGNYKLEGQFWTRQDTPELIAARARGYIDLWSAVSGTILLNGKDSGQNITAGERITVNVENASGEYELGVRSSNGTVYKAASKARIQAGSTAILNVIIEPVNPTRSADFHTELVGGGRAVGITGYTGRGGNVVIPAQIDGLPVVAIGSGAFYNNKDITSVTIPEGITSLGSILYWFLRTGIFEGCTNLVSVNFPSSLRIIGDETFLGCSKLETIIIPATITEIGAFAFSKCARLNTVTIKSKNIAIHYRAFANNPSLTTINLESDAAINWKSWENTFEGSRLNTASTRALRNSGYSGGF